MPTAAAIRSPQDTGTAAARPRSRFVDPIEVGQELAESVVCRTRASAMAERIEAT